MGTLREHVHGPRLIPLLPSLQFCNIVFPSLSEEEVHQLATAAFGSADAATEPRIDEEGSEAGTSDGGASVKKLPASVLDSPLLTNTPSQRKRMLKRQLSGGMTAREVRLEAVRDAEGPGVIARVTAAAAAAVGASPAPSPGPAKGSRTPSPGRSPIFGGGGVSAAAQRAAAAWGGARVGADHPLSRGGSGKSLEQSPLLEGGTSLQGGAVAKAARDHCTAHWHRKGSTSPAAAAAATHSRAVLGAVQHLAGKIDEIERKHAEETSALKELLAKQQLSLNAIAHRLGATTVAAATVAQRVAERVERESVRQGSEASVRSEGSKGV